MRDREQDTVSTNKQNPHHNSVSIEDETGFFYRRLNSVLKSHVRQLTLSAPGDPTPISGFLGTCTYKLINEKKSLKTYDDQQTAHSGFVLHEAGTMQYL